MPEISYDGEAFRILTGETNYTYIVAEETNGELLNDAIFTANTYVTEQFDVTLDDSVWVKLEGHGEPAMTMFADNRVAFTLALHLADQIKPAIANDVPYGIVPYPKISVNEQNYYGACTDYLFTIPLTVKDDERVGAVLEAMAYSGYKYVRPAYCEQTLQTRYATDPDCSEMLNLIFDNRVISFAYLYSDLQSDLIAKTVVNKNVASFLQSQSKVEQKTLKNKICKIFRDE